MVGAVEVGQEMEEVHTLSLRVTMDSLLPVEVKMVRGRGQNTGVTKTAGEGAGAASLLAAGHVLVHFLRLWDRVDVLRVRPA
jgi:hypothetical protein